MELLSSSSVVESMLSTNGTLKDFDVRAKCLLIVSSVKGSPDCPLEKGLRRRDLGAYALLRRDLGAYALS